MRKAWVLGTLVLARGALGWTLLASGISGWSPSDLPVYVNPSACPLPQAALVEFVDGSLSLWNSVPTSGLTLRRAERFTTDTAQDYLDGTARDLPAIYCDEDFEAHFGNADLIPAATMVNPTGESLDRAAIFLNAAPGAFAAVDALTDVQRRVVMAHEVGHMLGLGHSSRREALMYYSIAKKPDAILTEDDWEGLTYLYPRNEFAAGPFACGAVSRLGHPLSLLGALAFVAGLVGCGRRWGAVRRTEPLPELREPRP